MEIILTHINSTQPGEGDFLLGVASLGLSRKLDSYYFALDIDDTSHLSPRVVTRSLVKHFHALGDLLLSAGSLDAVYLPIEYSDEYIGCFRITTSESNALIDYGFTTQYQGASHWPSYLDLFMPTSFEPLTPQLTTSVSLIAAALKNVILSPIAKG